MPQLGMCVDERVEKQICLQFVCTWNRLSSPPRAPFHVERALCDPSGGSVSEDPSRTATVCARPREVPRCPMGSVYGLQPRAVLRVCTARACTPPATHPAPSWVQATG